MPILDKGIKNIFVYFNIFNLILLLPLPCTHMNLFAEPMKFFTGYMKNMEGLSQEDKPRIGKTANLPNAGLP